MMDERFRISPVNGRGGGYVRITPFFGRRARYDRVWWIASLVGVISIVAGIIVVAKPSNSLATLAVVSGIFVLIDGIVAVVEALGRNTESRGLVAILGVVNDTTIAAHNIASSAP